MTKERDFLRLRPEMAMDYENGFYWYSSPNRLAKLCAHYELYKKIIDLPGDVIETGVFKASTLIRLATFRHFLEVPISRAIYAFDAFGVFPQKTISLPEDSSYAQSYDGNFGQGLSTDEVMNILDAKGMGANVHCIQGDITETMPLFFQKNPYMRLAFVHVDVEVYEPTMTILELCWPRLIPGGIIALDDFNGTTGAAKAINTYFADKQRGGGGGGGGVLFNKIPFADAPAFICKE